MSRRVLLVCYYFPPLGLGGIGRPLNLFKRLPRYGWDCDVLTVKPVLYRAYEPELLDGLDKSRIHRSGSYDPQRLLYRLGLRKVTAPTISQVRPVADRFFPDSKVGWVRPATRLGSRLYRQARYDAVISTSPPMSSHLVGLKLAQEHRTPWVADFRDFWTVYKAEEVYSDERVIARARGLLQDIRARSSAVTAINRLVAEYVGKGEAIPNGFDPDLAELWRRPPSSELFTIGLLGHQHDTRELEPLLRLLEQLKTDEPERLKMTRLLQVGQVDEAWLRKIFVERGLGLVLDFRGRQRRVDTIRILADAHLFYLGISDKEGAVVLPGRAFELLASGRPLLIYGRSDTELARLVEPSGRACRFHDDTHHTAVDFLKHQMVLFERATWQYCPLDEYSQQYSADKLAERFAQLLNRLI